MFGELGKSLDRCGRLHLCCGGEDSGTDEPNQSDVCEGFFHICLLLLQRYILRLTVINENFVPKIHYVKTCLKASKIFLFQHKTPVE